MAHELCGGVQAVGEAVAVEPGRHQAGGIVQAAQEALFGVSRADDVARRAQRLGLQVIEQPAQGCRPDQGRHQGKVGLAPDGKAGDEVECGTDHAGLSRGCRVLQVPGRRLEKGRVQRHARGEQTQGFVASFARQVPFGEFQGRGELALRQEAFHRLDLGSVRHDVAQSDDRACAAAPRSRAARLVQQFLDGFLKHGAARCVAIEATP